MKHQTLEQLKDAALVHPDRPLPAMTRSERLQRWAELLEREPDRRLGSLPGTEYQLPEARDGMRSAGSPVTVAFEDPILRAQGLKNDTYGEAKRFFEINDRQLHGIVCYCHHGATLTAGTAARHVRAAIGDTEQFGIFARLRDAIGG